MYRFILFFLLLLSFCFGEPLNKEEAFKLSISSDKTGVTVHFNVDESVYLYKDKLKIYIDNTDIGEFLNYPRIQKEGKYDTYIGKFDLFIPFNLIKSSILSEKFKLNVAYQGCSKSGFCYQPMNDEFVGKIIQNEISIQKIQIKENLQSEQDRIASMLDGGKFIAIITFFGYGLLLSLTPCILPMIPILSGIIVAKGGVKSVKHGFLISFVYVFFMSVAYAIAGVLVSAFGASIQGLLQIPSVIIIFSLIFVALALSMFGFYDIQMPSFLQNYINKKSECFRGIFGVGIIGFMSALIVGPCVAAPLAGALLYIANTGDIIFGALALFVMSFGMGVPLLLIGLGSSRLLPKPGFWMEKIKQIFGFLMLAMAIWMLQRVLAAEITYILYGILGVFAAVYLGAFDTVSDGLSKFIKSIAILIFIGSCVLIVNFLTDRSELKMDNFSQAKNNFIYVKNLDTLQKIVDESKKPVMIDFWASWCVSCKELDEITFRNPEVIDRLMNFTLVKIDVTNNTKDDLELMNKFGVFGPPALIFYQNKQELTEKRIIGYIGADELLNILSEI